MAGRSSEGSTYVSSDYMCPQAIAALSAVKRRHYLLIVNDSRAFDFYTSSK